MEGRVLILAPRGRDAAIAAELLDRNGIASHPCADLTDLIGAIGSTTGAVMITEEALAAADSSALAGWVADQPTWSDLPFIVLANGARAPRSPKASCLLESLGNVMLLERPLHADAMLGAVRSALKARQWQYKVRESSEALEGAVAERTAELEAARTSLELALEAAGMGSWDIDLATGEARRTLRHDQLFGYAELQPRWSVEVFLGHVDPAHRSRIAASFDRAAAVGGLAFECPIVTVDGAHRWITVKGELRYDPAGRPVRIAGVVSDITDRRHADEQLAQAQKMDAIGQLTGGVAHDFNNLLTPIIGTLDLLRRRHADDERSQRLVGGAMQAAERASILTQRLLAFARRQTLQPQAVDVGALVDGILDLIRRSLGPTVTVVPETPRHLPSARVDPNQLELALLNLAINARDAMPGGGRLTIALSAVAVGEGEATGLAPGDYIRLVASDTGIGMDRATLARAAEPFFSTKGVGKGTGLGLSMVHGLAAQSGGTLEIESRPGEGTSVALWLPATDEVAGSTAVRAPDPVPTGMSARILLVDDEEIVRTATADMLRDIGYDVVEVRSASQALAAVKSGIDADVLVTDYLMPGMTGAELIKELRLDGSRLPTLLITGYAATGEDVPADVPRLAKPFRQSDIAARISELLQPRPDRTLLRAVK